MEQNFNSNVVIESGAKELHCIPNDQNISEIRFKMNIHNFCPLGDDWYTNELEVSFVPYKVIPDYVYLDNELRALDGKSLIIEDVVNKVYELISTMNPIMCEVKSHVSDAKHLAVDVIKRK